MGRRVYEPLIARPDRLCGGIGSSYRARGPILSKHFKKAPLR